MTLAAHQLSIAGLCDYATAEKWVPALEKAMASFDIDTPARQAAFLAQCSHESGKFRFLVENLNYSADGLLRTFKKYFTPETAAQYARRPEAIGNRVYGGRMGNATNEGFAYRGRGLLQCTGREMYKALSDAAKVDFLTNPDLLATPEWAAWSAALVWKMKGCNQLADAEDIDSISRRINGGTNGLEERRRLYKQTREVFTD